MREILDHVLRAAGLLALAEVRRRLARDAAARCVYHLERALSALREVAR